MLFDCRHGVFTYILFSILINTLLAENDSCVSKTSCRDCLRTRGCSWCSQHQFADKPRCFASGTTQILCDSIVDYENEITLIENRNLTKEERINSSHGSSSTARDSSTNVQISPQRVHLKLRINKEHALKFRYSQAEDYPIDLYYLMDLSKSMEDDKQTLSMQGDILTQAMKNITSNFRLGFGSFVDKVLMPYVSTVPDKLKEPCPNCTAPYGFRNHMSLNINSKEFSEEVAKSNVSGNLDAPEGGFDAIMQAIVCRKEIGWREGARRLLLFSTDAGFHYAGDGKLGGVIMPNDGLCHLNSQGYYDYSSVQDYPSISHINQKVKQHSVNIIFAVTESQQTVYQKLSQHVEGSSCAKLSENSSNVVQLVKSEYNKISSSIEMKDNATSAVKITYYSNCLSGGNETKTNKCDNLRVGDVVQFTAEIVLVSCPSERKNWHQIIQIYPVGLDESMIIDLEMICDCECEHIFDKNAKSVECNNNGLYKCGICDCDDFHSGKTCECSMTDLHTEQTSKADRCRASNTTTLDCNGRGTCVCGQCECNKRDNPDEIVQGKFCECENFSCDRSGGLLCSGPDHGTCECGSCQCLLGWKGNACECRDAPELCLPRGGGEICSGHGRCECGACICDSNDDGRFLGRYCENCPTCQGRCNELKDCVQCLMYNTGPLSEQEAVCQTNCTSFVPRGVPKPIVENAHEHQCTFYDEHDCKFVFVYTDDEKLKVRAQEHRECPQPVYVLGIVFGVIAAIVLIGLAILLLWKLLTTIHDRREFAKFEKERSMAKWDTGENPIYKQATSTFKNPTYSGK